jgi:hypothetical protein
MNKTGFSLASLFFLTIVVAILASGVRTAAFGPNPIEPEMLQVLAFCGSILGMVVGGFVGSHIDCSTAGKLVAVAAGAAFGGPSLILSVTGAAVPVTLIGSVVLFLFVWIVQKLSSSPSDEQSSQGASDR